MIALGGISDSVRCPLHGGHDEPSSVFVDDNRDLLFQTCGPDGGLLDLPPLDPVDESSDPEFRSISSSFTPSDSNGLLQGVNLPGTIPSILSESSTRDSSTSEIFSQSPSRGAPSSGEGSERPRESESSQSKRHSCPHCFETFYYLNNVQRHIASKHKDKLEGFQPFYRDRPTCKYSLLGRRGGRPDGWPRRDNLKRHMETHLPKTCEGTARTNEDEY